MQGSWPGNEASARFTDLGMRLVQGSWPGNEASARFMAWE